MTRRTFGGSYDAYRGIALGLFWAQAASGQAAPDAGAGDCTPSRGPHDECPERCPSFDTCYTDEGGGQLSYRVKSERFECDGLDCIAANEQLGDYCCQRGEYAPSRGGGGCVLEPATDEAGSRACAAVACLGALVASRAISRRARRPQALGEGGSPSAQPRRGPPLRGADRRQ